MKHGAFLGMLCVLLNFLYLPAQAPDTLWTRTFGGISGDNGQSVQQTTDSGYIIAGSTESFGAGNTDVWLIKTNVLGDTLWTRTFGGSAYDFGYSVQQTIDGGYIITGSTQSFGAVNNDVLLIKTDALGDTLWIRTFDGSCGYSIQQTTDEGYIIAAEPYQWLIKTNAIGDTLWTKSSWVLNACHSVQQTTDGGYIIAGYQRTMPLGSQNAKIVIIKTDSLGDTEWTRSFQENATNIGNSVQQTADGGYVITGFVNGYGLNGEGNICLIKLSASGDSLWMKIYDIYGRGESVQQTTDGGFIITGYTWNTGFNYDVLLIKTDASGDTLWTKVIGGNDADFGNAVQETTDGGYIIAGTTNSFGAGSYNFWLIKIAPDPTKIRKKDGILSAQYRLTQNYPNPFNPSTTIAFDLPEKSEVSLKVFNILGEKVATLVSDRLSAGSYSYDLDASKLASGVYLYSLHASDYVETRKMILMR
jgi:hypothetical protein